MEGLSFEDHQAASAVAALGGSAAAAAANKRSREECSSPADAAGGVGAATNKRGRHDAPLPVVAVEAPVAIVQQPPAAAVAPVPNPIEGEGSNSSNKPAEEEPKPYPFFYYEDHSKDEDPDSLCPLTPPGRVPNFPAKMHSILSRPDLADIICWMPHGRSWRVLKPREFEVKVIPTYFEHSKFSSFIRQANGWGFRRVTQGRDRNSYYHPLFLRGLPHLCKQMKRPGVSEKVAADPEHEPDFYKISELFPVPDRADDDSILLQCTLQGGPKARMPVYAGALSSLTSSSATMSMDTDMKPAAAATTANSISALLSSSAAASTSIKVPDLTPRDQTSLASFQQALGASENQLKGLAVSSAKIQGISNHVAPVAKLPALPSHSLPVPASGSSPINKSSPLAVASQLAFTGQPQPAISNMAAAQFAAGFAAATVLSQQQLRSMLGSFAFVPSPVTQQAQQQNQASATTAATHGFHFLTSNQQR